MLLRALIASSLLLFAPLSVFAELQPIDSIVAIVNDDVVTENELSFRMKVVKDQMKDASVPLPSDDLLRPQVLDRFIEQMLILQTAERYGIKVDDQMLNQTVQNIARKNNTTVSGLRQMLEKEGVNYTDFLDDLRRQLTVQRTEQAFVADTIHLSEDEVEHLYQQTLNANDENKQYRVGHILISLPKDPTSEQLTQAQSRADKAYEALQNKQDFFDVALRYSNSKDVLNSADLGLRKRTELPTLFSDVVTDMSLKDVHEPIRSTNGFHVIQLLEVKESQAQQHVVEEYRARHILVTTTRLRNEDEAKKQIDSIYKQLQNGTSFAELAKTYSDDLGSKQSGGELDWTQPQYLAPAFAKTMVELPVGTVSKPVKSDFGWHVIEVLDKRERDLSGQVLKANIQEQIFQRKLHEALQNWYTQLRDEAVIKTTI